VIDVFFLSLILSLMQKDEQPIYGVYIPFAVVFFLIAAINSIIIHMQPQDQTIETFKVRAALFIFFSNPATKFAF
jgi:hypothetical protein